MAISRLFDGKITMSTSSITQNAYAVGGGCSFGLLLLYLGTNVPSLFSIDAYFNYGETFVMIVVLGITFGYYLGKSFGRERSGFSVFTASFLASVTLISIVLLLTSFPHLPFNSLIVDWNTIAAIFLPFLVSFSLIQGDLLTGYGKAKSAFNYFCSKVSWYLFEVHLMYVYGFPLLTSLISQIQTNTINPSTVINSLIFTSFLVVFLVIIRSIITVNQEAFQDSE